MSILQYRHILHTEAAKHTQHTHWKALGEISIPKTTQKSIENRLMIKIERERINRRGKRAAGVSWAM